jgi:hypothetical protein
VRHRKRKTPTQGLRDSIAAPELSEVSISKKPNYFPQTAYYSMFLPPFENPEAICFRSQAYSQEHGFLRSVDLPW